jgi:uncharacterized protein YggE
MRRTPTAALAAPLLAAAVLLGGCTATPTQAAASPPTVTTRGVGTVRGTPDMLTVVLGVQTRAASAAQALTDADTRTSGLLDVLRGRGVAAADLRTSGLSISPTFDSTGGITGYEVDNEVTATLRDIARAGDLLDASARAAGDAARIRQISFAIDDDAEPRARARADAVGQARAQARQLADAAQVTLGPILSITEVPAGGPPAPIAADARAAASVPVEPGSQEVSVVVEVVHALGT